MFYAPFVRCEILQFRYPAPVIIRYQSDEDLREVDPCDERSKRDHQNKQDLLIKTKVPDVRQQFVEIYVFRLFFDIPVCFSRLRIHRVATGHRVIFAVVQMNGGSKFLLRWHFLGNHKLIDRFERKSDRLSRDRFLFVQVTTNGSLRWFVSQENNFTVYVAEHMVLYVFTSTLAIKFFTRSGSKDHDFHGRGSTTWTPFVVYIARVKWQKSYKNCSRIRLVWNDRYIGAKGENWTNPDLKSS